MNLNKGNKLFDIPLISMMYMSMMYINYILKFFLIMNIFGIKIFCGFLAIEAQNYNWALLWQLVNLLIVNLFMRLTPTIFLELSLKFSHQIFQNSSFFS